MRSVSRMAAIHQSPVCSQLFASRLVVVFILAVVVVVVCLSSRSEAANSDANRLYEDLMMSYNRFVRPVQNDSDTLVVKLGLKLSQLIDVVSSP